MASDKRDSDPGIGIEETALAPAPATIKDNRHREIPGSAPAGEGLDETLMTPSQPRAGLPVGGSARADADALGDTMATPPQPVDPQAAGPRVASGSVASGGRRGTCALEAGDRLGRYVVLEIIGAGGMGEVYSAYDPELDRRIALKVIRPSADDSETLTTARGRLLREAQAMAQLSHPNVISVFDVGTLADNVYVAMEYVEGQDLRAWAALERPEWREVLELYIAAARGLAAAHDADMVHRDFKPDNVLLGKDGRVRVIDFGLARQAETATGGARAPRDKNALLIATARSISPSASASTTRTGAVMGTPAYMAPEQFEGAATDPRTDQFNFFVSLYEALYGERPFAGDSFTSLALNVTEGILKPLPKDSDVPDWLARVVVRGLSRDVDARFPSMAAAIEALLPPEQRHRRWPWIAAAVAIVVVGTLVATRLFGGAAGATPCQGLEQPLAGVWDQARKQEVEQAFAATGRANSAEVWQRVEATLNEYAQSWVLARVDACEDTAVRKEQSDEMRGRRMACLDRRLSELDAVIAVMSAADADVVDNGTQAAASLKPVATCSNRTRLMKGAPRADEVVDRQLARVKALDAAGKYQEGLELALDTLRRARVRDGRAGEALALFWVGKLRSAVGDTDEAIERLFEAVRVADASGDLEAEAEAWVSIVSVTTSGLARPAEGARWAEHARLAVAQAGGDLALQGGLKSGLAQTHFDQKRYEEALSEFRASAALRERAHGPNDWRTALTRGMVGSTLRRVHRYEEAAAEHVAALAALERALGPNHPRVASLLNNCAISLGRLDRFAEAKGYLERALAIQTATFGADHKKVTTPLVNLATHEERLGNYAAAVAHIERALAIREKVLDADHPAIPKTRNHLARLQRVQGHFDEAVAVQRQVLERFEVIHGADHELTGNMRAAMCDALTRQGDLRAAEKECEHAVRTLVDAPDQANRAWALTFAGKLDVLRGRPRVAVERLEQALKIRTSAPGRSIYLAQTQFALAMALDAAGQERARARELAVSARDALLALPVGDREWLPEIEAWLKKRGY